MSTKLPVSLEALSGAAINQKVASKVMGWTLSSGILSGDGPASKSLIWLEPTGTTTEKLDDGSEMAAPAYRARPISETPDFLAAEWTGRIIERMTSQGKACAVSVAAGVWIVSFGGVSEKGVEPRGCRALRRCVGLRVARLPTAVHQPQDGALVAERASSPGLPR
jgi:hypothetical protein